MDEIDRLNRVDDGPCTYCGEWWHVKNCTRPDDPPPSAAKAPPKPYAYARGKYDYTETRTGRGYDT